MINWGIIGLGTIANTFASDLKLVSNANLYAVASRDIEKAIKFRDTHEASICYSSYNKLANDPNVDIIYISTPHTLHFENAKMCLERGIAVLCEKPMGISASQTKELCEIAKANDTLLMEAMWTAFLPNFQRLQEIVNQKKLGSVKNVEIDFCFTAPNDSNHRLINKSLGGGTLLDIGIYNIYTCLELFGIPNKYDAFADIGATGIDMSCNLVFQYNNFEAKLKSSFTEDTPTEIHIEFENGTITLGPNFFAPSDLKIRTSTGEEIINKHPEGTGYQLEAIHFQDLFQNNQTESPVHTHQKSIRLATYLDIMLDKIGVSYE